jgi:hypothetical protein
MKNIEPRLTKRSTQWFNPGILEPVVKEVKQTLVCMVALA